MDAVAEPGCRARRAPRRRRYRRAAAPRLDVSGCTASSLRRGPTARGPCSGTLGLLAPALETYCSPLDRAAVPRGGRSAVQRGRDCERSTAGRGDRHLILFLTAVSVRRRRAAADPTRIDLVRPSARSPITVYGVAACTRWRDILRAGPRHPAAARYVGGLHWQDAYLLSLCTPRGDVLSRMPVRQRSAPAIGQRRPPPRARAVGWERERDRTSASSYTAS